MSLEIQELPAVVELWRNRYIERDARHAAIAEVLSGSNRIYDPDEDELEKAAANLIQVACEDTGDAAAVMPSIRVRPYKPTQPVKAAAEKMERVAQHYARASRLRHLLSPTVQRLAAYGVASWVIWPDFEQDVPIIELRDSRGCYPQPGIRPGERARQVLYLRQVRFDQLPQTYREKLVENVGSYDELRSRWLANGEITLVEYFDEEEILIGGLMMGHNGPFTAGPGATVARPVELDRIPHGLKVCPVVLGERFVFDDEHRGQFDQVVGPQAIHSRLQALLLAYADQAVYSDIWVKDAIGEITMGGGSYITLGPNGGIGRVPPAVSALNVFQDLSVMEESIHTGGRWPKSRPGDITQSIASAKFLEASAGMMNTVIKGYHMILESMITNAIQLCFEMDAKVLPGTKQAQGVLRNQEFLTEYSTGEIDDRNIVTVDYGLGLGRDPSQSAVLQIQYAQNGYISEEFVQESIEGVNDVGRERARIDAQKFKDIIFGKLIEQVQMGTVNNRQLLELARKRYEGSEMFDLFEEYVVKPEEAAAAEMANAPMSGLGAGPNPLAALMGGGGPPMGPGGPPGPGGPGGAPGMVPPPPDPSTLLSRINTDAGPGGTLGAQTLGPGNAAPVPA